MEPKSKQPHIPESANVSLPAAYSFVSPERRTCLAAKLPRVIFIEVTNSCNLLCATCPHTFASYEPIETMSWDRFLHIVGQFPDMQRALLHGIGEPLLNKNLPRMIAYLKARQVAVLFNTNAVLLDQAWARALIDSGLDELHCSIDTADPTTYARIRGAPAFAKVKDNLANFAALQRRLKAASPRVSLWMTGMKDNIAALPDLVRLAAEIGVPEVYVQRMVYYLDVEPADAPGMMHAGQGVFHAGADGVEDVIAEAEAIAARLGVQLRASGATDPRHSLGASREREERPWRACLRPWTTAYVTVNGNCLPCCLSPFATNDYSSLKMGNIIDSPFAEIWNGEAYRMWRSQMLKGEPPVPCRGCGVYWSL